MQFLRGEVESEEQRSLARSSFTDSVEKKKVVDKGKKQNNKDKRSTDYPTAYGLAAGQISGCIFCNKAHASQDCVGAQKLTLSQRKEKVKEKNYCFVCLKPNHTAKNCKVYVKCVVCGKRHYTLMCNEIEKRNKEDQAKSTDENVIENANPLASKICSPEILLMTCLVKIKGPCGRTRICRALFDSGSHLTRIKRSIVKSLGLKPVDKENLRTAVYGGDIITASHSLFDLEIEDINGVNKRYLKAYDEEILCGARLPRIPRGPWLKELASKGISLYDSESHSEEIDLLIGNRYFQKLLTGRRIESSFGYIAVETTFGWTLTGALNAKKEDKSNVAMAVTSLFVNEADLTQLWKLDVIDINDPVELKSKTEKDVIAFENFVKTLERREDGRYSVCLPWKEQGLMPPDNKVAAEKRLQSVTSRLEKTGQLIIYDNLIREWIKEGLIELVTTETENKVHYLPHRPVFKLNSDTTPVRPVFDASCRGIKGPSLNDCLEKGPNFIELISPILLRFRKGKLGIIADVRKAFQMIEINERDRDALRFLWWKNPLKDKQMEIFRHKRVVFGVNYSPFILGAVLEYHFRKVCEKDVLYAEILLKSIYVDNCATSVNSEEDYLDFKQHATRILADGKMNLRQWECSYHVGPFDNGDDTINMRQISNVLGMVWNKETDILRCNIQGEELPELLTKRIILSSVQRIYDPLGILCPVTLTPKTLL